MIRLIYVLISIIMPIAQAGAVLLDSENIAKTGLSKQQAKQIAILVFQHEEYLISDPRFFIIEEQNKADYVEFNPRFTMPDTIPSLGYYIVNIKTGDVWEIMRCHRFTFPELKKLQYTIMHRTGSKLKTEEQVRNEICF